MKQPIQKPTDEEINRIDNILDQLDVLRKQLPEDYQQDYAYQILDELGIEEME